MAKTIDLYEADPSKTVTVTIGALRRMWADTVRGCRAAADDRPLDPYWYEHAARVEIIEEG